MGIGVTIAVILAVIFLIWVSAEFKRAKHKVLAFVLIIVVLFAYFSISFVFKEKKIDVSNINGLKQTAQIYFSWFSTAFSNVKSFTANVINWKGSNNTQIK